MLSADVISDFLTFNAKAAGITDMTNLKVNKLLYFAQGMYLARYGCPLFEDAIEAWNYGPVVRSIYEKYGKYGKTPVEYCGDKFDLEQFSVDEIDCIMDTLGLYGDKDGSSLVEISHEQDPWKNNYDSNLKRIIPVDEIKDYFVKHKSEYERTYMEDEFVGYNNQDGHLVLPAEMDF